MLLDHIVNFCDTQYSHIGTNCPNATCNHPSGQCSGSCYNCLYQIHFPSRFKDTTPKMQYDCIKMLYHYVCQYSYLYTTEVLWALFTEWNLIKNNSYFHILSLGCGGCADLMAFDYLLSEGKIEVPISYLGIDINPLWHQIHNEIKNYYVENKLVKFNIPGYFDAFECFNNPLSDVNVIIISYLISYLYNTNQIGKINLLADRIAQNIVIYKKYGQHLLLIINDVNSNARGRDYFSYFINSIRSSGAKILNSKYMYFDTGNLNYYQTNGFTKYENATGCCFEIPQSIKNKYHAQEELNATIQLLLEVE